MRMPCTLRFSAVLKLPDFLFELRLFPRKFALICNQQSLVGRLFFENGLSLV